MTGAARAAWKGGLILGTMPVAHMTKALFEIAEVSYSAVAETSISDCGDHRQQPTTQQPNNPTTHPNPAHQLLSGHRVITKKERWDPAEVIFMRCNNCPWAQDLVCHEPRGSCRWRVLCHAWEGAPQTMIPPARTPAGFRARRTLHLGKSKITTKVR